MVKPRLLTVRPPTARDAVTVLAVQGVSLVADGVLVYLEPERYICFYHLLVTLCIFVFVYSRKISPHTATYAWVTATLALAYTSASNGDGLLAFREQPLYLLHILAFYVTGALGGYLSCATNIILSTILWLNANQYVSSEGSLNVNEAYLQNVLSCAVLALMAGMHSASVGSRGRVALFNNMNAPSESVLAFINHELRTPMVGIYSVVDLMKRAITTRTTVPIHSFASDIAQIESSSRAILKTLDQLKTDFHSIGERGGADKDQPTGYASIDTLQTHILDAMKRDLSYLRDKVDLSITQPAQPIQSAHIDPVAFADVVIIAIQEIVQGLGAFSDDPFSERLRVVLSFEIKDIIGVSVTLVEDRNRTSTGKSLTTIISDWCRHVLGRGEGDSPSSQQPPLLHRVLALRGSITEHGPGYISVRFPAQHHTVPPPGTKASIRGLGTHRLAVAESGGENSEIPDVNLSPASRRRVMTRSMTRARRGEPPLPPGSVDMIQSAVAPPMSQLGDSRLSTCRSRTSPHTSPATSRRAESKQPVRPPPPPAVLIVEDDPVSRSIVKRQCSMLNIPAKVAKDGVEAFELIMNEAADQRTRLVLMDINMPKMDGLSCTAAIRRWDREKGGIDRTIVAFSAAIFPEDRRSYIESGMDDVLRKPCTLSTLRQCLTQFGVLDPA